jgi:uncharacterized protein (DUF488 family)
MMQNYRRIYTIGHSNHDGDTLLSLLTTNGAEIVADIRSRPYSRFCPHADKNRIERSLTNAGIRYLYLGRLLGGMPEEDEFYDDEGYVLYDALIASPRFLEGVSLIEELIAHSRTVLMCAEEDPSRCHRRFLVGSVLLSKDIELWHIRKDGSFRVDSPSNFPERSDPGLYGRQLSLFEDSTSGGWKSSRPVRKRRGA